MMDLLLRDYLINLFYLFFLLLWPDDKFNQSATIKEMSRSTRHWWFSGRILACHAGGLGSIPG